MLEPPFYMWVLNPQSFENDLYQDKVLQPRVCANKGGNGSNGMTKCSLVEASYLKWFSCILEWLWPQVVETALRPRRLTGHTVEYALFIKSQLV